MLEMKQAGARTIAQDEDSCVVFGMPKVAIQLGGVDEILPLESIANRIFALLNDERPLRARTGNS
jgi:two-component system chemotaxis response regulator CheB